MCQTEFDYPVVKELEYPTYMDIIELLNEIKKHNQFRVVEKDTIDEKVVKLNGLVSYPISVKKVKFKVLHNLEHSKNYKSVLSRGKIEESNIEYRKIYNSLKELLDNRYCYARVCEPKSMDLSSKVIMSLFCILFASTTVGAVLLTQELKKDRKAPEYRPKSELKGRLNEKETLAMYEEYAKRLPTDFTCSPESRKMYIDGLLQAINEETGLSQATHLYKVVENCHSSSEIEEIDEEALNLKLINKSEDGTYNYKKTSYEYDPEVRETTSTECDYLESRNGQNWSK